MNSIREIEATLKALRRAKGERLATIKFDGEWPEGPGDYCCAGCGERQNSDAAGEDYQLDEDYPTESYSRYPCGGGWWVIELEPGEYWWVGRCGQPLEQQTFPFLRERV